jgi:RecB family exonuclease
MTAGSGFSSRIPLEQLTGLRPRAWLSVGEGFSREDIKAFVLARGQGFTGEAITQLSEIALRIVSQHDPRIDKTRVLKSLARQEVLRILLADPRIGARLPELKRLKRQSGFYRKLDQAIQAGRLAFAHWDECAVYSERLASRFGGGGNPLRDELVMLAFAYEAWLEAGELIDPPLLVQRAIRAVQENGWPERLSRPETILVFGARTEESLERAFWDTLERHVRIERVGPLQEPQGIVMDMAQDMASPADGPRDAIAPPSWQWDLWHTIDDAAEELADRMARDEAATAYRDCVVLIPDSSSARRSLRRALEARGVPLADPRDPTRLRWDEGLKWATLPLTAVARRFERDSVIAYLRGYCAGPELPAWVAEIQSRGIRMGLQSYTGGKLAAVAPRLSELQDALGGRRACEDLADAHLRFLRAATEGDADRQWIPAFFESLWREFAADMERVKQADRKAPPLFWWERLQARLSESPAPVERFKPEQGVAVYRLHQAPLSPPRRLYVLGLPANWLAGEGVGDYWFSERERETLCSEFAVRSSISQRRERLAALAAWVGQARQVTWLDASYDVDGRERESIDAPLGELAKQLGLAEDAVPAKPRERGAHPRWIASYGALRPLPPQQVSLAPLPRGPTGAPPEITATALDSYSRCGFMALAYQRWRLRDVRQPDTDLWPEARGNILHAAVRLLLESRDESGRFSLTSREALDQAWKLENPRGLLRSARTESYARDRMVQVLDAFREKEYEYFDRAPSKIASLDSQYFKLEFEDVAIIGTPDRIDEHPEGIFVLDYKTSSALPHGTDMLELGYRTQLPFYALAARRELSKPVLGVQFVELNKRGGRGSGIFFKRYNGKEPGKLTTLTARSKSLLSLEPEDAWAALSDKLHAQASGFVSGQFAARPTKAKECDNCLVADLCGFRRLTERPSEASAQGFGEGVPE